MGLPDIDNIPDTGAVFTIGRSRFADNVASHFFIRKDPVISIACGDEHSAVVCQSGRLFVFGSNDWGQLGLGHKNHVSKPSCVKSLKPEKVSHVACGRAHTLICTNDQKIFSCGSDQEAQLGRGQSPVDDSTSTPTMIHDFGTTKVLQIAAGSHHSLALTEDGKVLAWGSNLEGQLGLHGISGLISTPTQVHLTEPVKQISAGYYHSAFLTESGLVYVCGEAESGKLGIVLDFRTQLVPKPMSLSVKAANVACGGHHTLVLGDDDNVYCTGSNASGQLGMGTTVTEVQTPKQLPRGELKDEKIVKIVCGESHIAVVTDSGKLFTCGDGRHGKLGLEENENNVHELTYAIKYQELFVTNVACGGCHTILVGSRREMDNGDDESKQMKISALPPLKGPAPRIQNDSPLATKPDGPNIGSNEKDNEETDVKEGNEADTMASPAKSLDKPESPKKTVDYSESEEIKVKEDEMSNEKDQNADAQSSDKIETNQQDEAEKERPKSSEKMNGDNETIEENSAKEVMNEEQSESPPAPVPPPKPPRQKSSSAGSTASSRISSGRMSSEDKKSEGKPATDDKVGKNSIDDEDIVDENKKSDSGSTKMSTGSEKSQSGKSKVSDETIPIGMKIQNSLDGIGQKIQTEVDNQMEKVDKIKVEVENQIGKIEEKAVDTIATIEGKIDNIVGDDADVVQSPGPRGRILKLFNNLKRQDGENENKLNSPPNVKAKSKTCSIL